MYRDILKYRYRVSIFFNIELDIDIQGNREKVRIFAISAIFRHFKSTLNFHNLLQLKSCMQHYSVSEKKLDSKCCTVVLL